MSRFMNSSELRLTKNDILQLLEYAINEKIMRFTPDETVTNLTLHPGNKYVARVTIKGKNTQSRSSEQTTTNDGD